MQKMTFYEQLGIVIPGSVLMLGLVLFYPDLRILTVKDGVSVGDLGLFVLVAYAAGHLVAAIGNAIEAAFWKMMGGMPSDWITRDPPGLLSAAQIENVRTKAGSRLSISLDKMAGLERAVWWPISRQIYADVAKNGKAERIDTFNGVYGLNRGLASACFALVVVAAVHHHWPAVVGLAIAGAVYGFRAYRFGVHYAREMYLQFLVL